ncbi:zonadhesin-like isoform 2-T2 [Pholidichthys leucotaenia]
MLGVLLVTAAVLIGTQTDSLCRAENDLSSVALPEIKDPSEYVTQCFCDRPDHVICDWKKSNKGTVDILESGPLGIEGPACLEFWYLTPAAPKGSELQVLLKDSIGQIQIWTSPALPPNAWRQALVSLNATEPVTQVVFEAIQALSRQGQTAFKQIGLRRGLCGQQCERNTESWTDETTRCLCSGGLLSCLPSQCPAGQICGPHRGGSSGTSISGVCTIHSNSDYSTFDGVLFRFTTPYTGVLAKTCSSSEAPPMFSVKVVNEQNDDASLPAVQQIIVDIGIMRVSLLKRQMHRVVVNGLWKMLPLSLNSGTVNITSNPAAVVLATRFGLSVSFDETGVVHVTLPSTYSDKVCGLCGNFNNLKEDDLRMSNGTYAQSATAFAESWQKGNSTCQAILLFPQCDSQKKEEYAGELYCGGLLSSTGPFAKCFLALEAESYFRSCVSGMCSSHGDSAVLCETLQDYADICHKAGIAIPKWRNSTFCPIQCGENSHYNSCADGCPKVCSSLDIAGSCGRCEERCECDAGFKFSGGKCVPAEDCGCWNNGKHYKKGETFIGGDCVRQCQCMGNNATQCSAIKCANNEVCKLKNGIKDCFRSNLATCIVYGDPHYVTFDGKAYTFQGGCTYTLTTTSAGRNAVQFSVFGHNMYPRHQNFTRSKLEAVSLQVEDLYVTLNQSGEVYVQNKNVQLPYSVTGKYGSVRIYMTENFLKLETSFGLRMELDGQYRLYLQVDEVYKYGVHGLCGTYSDYQGDDFTTPSGKEVSDPFEFGNSWKMPNDKKCISHPNPPRLCDRAEEDKAYDACSAVLLDAFQSCHEHVHPSIYITSCVYDYCDTRGDRHTFCESLKSYATACYVVAGVKLPHWQAATGCEPPTTTTPPTTPSTPVCPINCNFEKNLCGWEQLITDKFDWTWHSGSTPTNQTGPNHDHTTGSGHYIYLEGDSATRGDSARLLSPVCHYNGPLCMQLWYHMYGSATAMALNIYQLLDNEAVKIWSMKNDHGPQWHPGYVDIKGSNSFQIILEGIRGATVQSDLAIDDISIHSGSCTEKV